jgi:basic amino acid/polyamine antiporter, APA family
VSDFASMNAVDQAAFSSSKSTAQLLGAWNNSPTIGGLKMILDLPALVINVLITYLVYRGIKESRNFSNAMVILKLAVVVLVIAVGAVYINTDNWLPISAEGTRSFMPNGFGGVMAAVSGVFFAYIGFDAVSVLAEESRNPQKDLPKGMIWSLIICTIVYILLALVLTGTVVYSKFANVGDPLAFIFEKDNLNIAWMQLLVAVCAVIAMTSVLLVFQMGQPRIWMSMSRDGLLPPVFEKIHPKYKTPSFSTIITGLVVGIPILFTDKTFVLDFTSIATLFAFVLVCGGVLLLPRKKKTRGRFNLPYINARFIFPLLLVGIIVTLGILFPGYFPGLFNFDFSGNADFVKGDITFMDAATPQISLIIFWLICIILSLFAVTRNFSLIPLMGLTTCLYLLTGMTKNNWAWFLSWLALGLIIYFLYGFRKSKLAAHNQIVS